MSPLRLSPLQHFTAAFAAVFIAATLFISAAANAQTRGVFYRAEMTQPSTQPRLIAGNVIWSCTTTSCIAPRGTSRPAVMCARLVREAGTVTRFVANGVELAAADLDRCNSAAR